MEKAKIFLVDDKEEGLTPMTETDYVTEDVLQDLLAHYPDLLPGDQIDQENPRRWLLVSREMGVPGDVEEPDRWSLDLLFLDQDGIPTFIECKRASDTRSRREVVAQMLDYAANGLEYWSIDRIRQAAAETAQGHGKTLEDELERLLNEDDADSETYWGQVKENLHDRRVRLIFVMDSIPKELRRLVEFLNEEMTHVEVLAVEVKQFQRVDNKGQKALVPRLVVGLTEKETLPRRREHTTHAEFLEKCTPEMREFFQRVLELAERRGHVIYWGEVAFSIRAHFPETGLNTFAYGWPSGVFQFYCHEDLLPLSVEEVSALRKELLDLGVFKEAGRWTLKATVTKENLARMNEVYDFILAKIDEIMKVH